MYDFYVYNEYYLCHFPNIIIMGGLIFLTNSEFVAKMPKYFTNQDFHSFMPLQ